MAQSETPAEQAAREIQEARDRANDAADEYFKAESTLQVLEDELIALERQETILQAEVDSLRSEVEAVALARYVSSGTAGIPLLTNVTDPQDQIQAKVYVDVLTNTGADVIDQFDAAESALRDTQDDVAERRRQVEDQRAQHAALRDAANEEVVRLRAIEEERLQDEAVQKALDAQLQKERARLEEVARLEAEAAARAQPNPGIVVPETTVPPSTTAPADGDAVATQAVGDEPAGDASDASADGESSDAPADTTPATTEPPVSTLPENSGGSGGTSGGRTGGGGGGSNPGGISTGAGYIDNIVCPMPGSAYGDTWGAPRSGGRRHQGVDMIAPRGVPIFAVTSGFATFKFNRLGGNAVSLVGDNGNRYYYAHLDRYEGASRRVAQGELIGYNGDTGNAIYSTPHLHFQVHPGGGQAVNPTPTVRAAGC
ncbi:MAG: peptidoglycan DD-metalloendopeptidase family protein [Ilumatobacter sp.]|uniref:peptidoglycan DD-metalloendopeptidase family protein n=1 Tax=Ilumatobacter sp. TaxID=1967498 RepID=UPI00391DBE38